MSGLKPSTLKANQVASLAPFPQAHAQNSALLISDDANGQDKKKIIIIIIKFKVIYYIL